MINSKDLILEIKELQDFLSRTDKIVFIKAQRDCNFDFLVCNSRAIRIPDKFNVCRNHKFDLGNYCLQICSIYDGRPKIRYSLSLDEDVQTIVKLLNPVLFQFFI